jgi:hypothetical protein
MILFGGDLDLLVSLNLVFGFVDLAVASVDGCGCFVFGIVVVFR